MESPGPFNFYGSQMEQLSQNIVVNSMQNGAQRNQDSLPSTSNAGKGKGPVLKKAAYDTMGQDETKLLVNLWVENHYRLESKDSRTAWNKVVETLNEQYKNNRTVDKCKRKMKYLLEKYKERSDWNKKQSGGHLWKSPFYDEIDAVLGTRDVVTFQHVEEASGSGANESTASTNDESSPSTSSKSAENALTGTQKRKSRKRKRASREESDDEVNHMKSLTEQGDKISEVIAKMQETQSKQVEMMGKFMEAMVNIMSQPK